MSQCSNLASPSCKSTALTDLHLWLCVVMCAAFFPAVYVCRSVQQNILYYCISYTNKNEQM